jgi:hypothetical protein
MDKVKAMKLSGLTLGLLLASAAVTNADTSDFALFNVDGTNPDSGAVCYSNGAFEYHVAVANAAAAENGVVRITYYNGDFVEFPIAAGASFAFSQAAGSKGGADKAVRVSNGDSNAELSGSMSAKGQGNVKCISCDGGGGDATCDSRVEDDTPVP